LLPECVRSLRSSGRKCFRGQRTTAHLDASRASEDFKFAFASQNAQVFGLHTHYTPKIGQIEGANQAAFVYSSLSASVGINHQRTRPRRRGLEIAWTANLKGFVVKLCA